MTKADKANLFAIIALVLLGYGLKMINLSNNDLQNKCKLKFSAFTIGFR